MKKFLVVFLTFALVISMAACVVIEDDEGGDGGKLPVQTDGQQDSTSGNDTTPPADTTPDVQDPEDISITEQVIYEANNIRVTAVSLEHDDFWGPSVKVKIENDSDKNIIVQARNSSVNGLMVTPMFSCDVAAGKKANDTITFMESELEIAGITTLKDIEFSLYILDADSWEEIATSDPITLTTTADPSYVQTFNDAGFVAYEDDSVKIVIQKLDSEDSFWGSDVYVYIENNGDTNFTVQARDVSINGYMVTPSFSCDVNAGKKAYSTITFFETDLEDNDITDITEMELSFHIFNMDSWDTLLDTDAVTVAFE